MTRLYLAFAGDDDGPALAAHDWDADPVSVLVAFPLLSNWNRCRATYGDAIKPEALMLDSGAYTAFTRGQMVDIDALMRECDDPVWDEIVGLDVIGSWEGSRTNLDLMHARGHASAMPVFHVGDPWDLLEYYCSKWDKVGLACSVLKGAGKAKYKFYDQCFAKAWPHKFHSFGWTGTKMLLRYPFHSADSSTWSLLPRAYNVLQQYGGSPLQVKKVPRPKMTDAMAGEIKVYADRQRQVAARWDNELKKLAV